MSLSAPNNTDPSANRTVYIHITAGRMKFVVSVTQKKYKVPGPIAAPGVIGYRKSDGQLTLKGSKEYSSNAAIKQFAIDNFGGLEDESVYVAYFKFGSIVAIGSEGGAGDTFDEDDIIAVPNNGFPYTLDAFKTYVDGGSTVQDKWERIDDAGDWVALAEGQNVGTNLSKGLGDPCAYWFDGVYNDNWRLPLGGASDRASTAVDGWNGGTFGTSPRNRTPSDFNSTWWNVGQTGLGTGIPAGRRGPSWDWYLPAAGYRGSAQGTQNRLAETGFYGTSTAADDRQAYYLSAERNYTLPAYTSPYGTGFVIRCVRP